MAERIILEEDEEDDDNMGFVYECEFCSALDDNDHSIDCPNDHSPFNDLLTRGYD